MAFTPQLSSARFSAPIGSNHPTSGISPSSYIQCALLVANTAQAVTLPKGTRFVSFSGAVSFYADFNGQTAVIPGASVTDGSAPCLNPGSRSVEGLCMAGPFAISLISAAGGNVTVECWS